jgi:hypothetical protein
LDQALSESVSAFGCKAASRHVIDLLMNWLEELKARVPAR